MFVASNEVYFKVFLWSLVTNAYKQVLGQIWEQVSYSVRFWTFQTVFYSILIEICAIQTYFNLELHLSKHCRSHSDFAPQYLSSKTPIAASCPPPLQDNLSKRSSNPSSLKHTIERTLSWHSARLNILDRLRNLVILGDFQNNFRPKNRNFQISSSFYWAILKIWISWWMGSRSESGFFKFSGS